MVEAEARKLVSHGRSELLKLQVKPFIDAAEQFIEWAKGEHREKPGTWKRLRGSMTSLKTFFGNQPLHTITVGQIQDYMSWRRTGDARKQISPVKEVTLRHDLHALSPLFEYGSNHNWCSTNPISKMKVPSDADAQRMHVLTTAEEMKYFDACGRLKDQHLADGAAAMKPTLKWAHQRSADAFQDLHDVGRLMILQGPRPSEVMQARTEHVALEPGTWFVPKSKSSAGRRSLKLTSEARSIFARRISQVGSSSWIFRGKKKGTHLTDIQNAHSKVLEDTGLAFVIYDFRHTAATRWAERGMDIATLAKLLGHANLRSVMRYIHISQDHMDQAVLRYGEPAGQENRRPAECEQTRYGTATKGGAVQ
jgi:integrase